MRPIAESDEARWHELWRGYLAFYEEALPAETTALTWERMHDPQSSISGIVAEVDDSGVVGIANYVLHESTWSRTAYCYLEDLFVDPEWRGMGVGARLIDWLVEEMHHRGWDRVYWHTREDNVRARALYDRYTPHSGFLRYVISAK